MYTVVIIGEDFDIEFGPDSQEIIRRHGIVGAGWLEERFQDI